MALKVTVFVAQASAPSSIPTVHVVEWKDWLPQAAFWPPRKHGGTSMYIYTTYTPHSLDR